jgi:protein SCO1/2
MNLVRFLSFIFCVIAAVDGAAAVPGVSFEQRVGETLPLDAVFRDTEGHAHRLGDWFRDRPVVLWFGYASCPQLCSVVANGMIAALRPLEASVGQDFDVVMISIDPTETATVAAASRVEALGQYGRSPAAAGWHYLTGSAAAIHATAEAAGFHFVYDERSKQYAHPSGFLVLTPQGRISEYFAGVDFSPKEVTAAITRAGAGGIGQKVADLLLLCFRGDGITGRYGLIIWRMLGAAVALTVIALGAGIGRMLWLEHKTRATEDGGSS